MARNSEKQQGRLNRVWLQRERDEGRLRDVQERRPKLSSLTSAASVKKWIPSITREMEYYLQQSQLPHYPERKIAEFQLQMHTLEKQYKSFITKLRHLDPTCRHKPWTPRAYCKRRADLQEPPGKTLLPCESRGSSPCIGAERELHCNGTGCSETSTPDNRGPLTPALSSSISDCSEAACVDQDRPLSFDHTRLAMATAAYRGPSAHQGPSQTLSLARVLQSGLPNLVNASFTSSIGTKEMEGDEKSMKAPVVGQKIAVQDRQSDCEATDSKPGTAERRANHVLGLDCYSSSDDEPAS